MKMPKPHLQSEPNEFQKTLNLITGIDFLLCLLFIIVNRHLSRREMFSSYFCPYPKPLKIMETPITRLISIESALNFLYLPFSFGFQRIKLEEKKSGGELEAWAAKQKVIIGHLHAMLLGVARMNDPRKWLYSKLMAFFNGHHPRISTGSISSK